jgi:hypothetical protein
MVGELSPVEEAGSRGGGGQTWMRFEGRRFPKELNNPRGVVWSILTASRLRVGPRS